MPPPPGGYTPPSNYPPTGYQPYQAAATPQFAGWGSRVGGHLVNGLVGVAFAIPAIIAFFASPKTIDFCTIDGEESLCEVPTGAGWAIIVGAAVAGLVAYLVLYGRKVSSTGQAWGHKVAGVRIVDANSGSNIGTGKAIARFLIGHWIDGLVCYLGYLWPLWDKKKQTFSDKIFSTYSIKA
jgi:uncharacterized RDD family membrane protein YckC